MAKKKTIESAGPSLFDNPTPVLMQDPIPTPTEPLPIIPMPQITDKSKEAPTTKSILSKSTAYNGYVRLRDGEILNMGDEVVVDDGVLTGILKESPAGKIFIIEKMTPWPCCESGVLVIAYQKDDPEKKTLGIGEKGIDANWFSKVK